MARRTLEPPPPPSDDTLVGRPSPLPDDTQKNRIRTTRPPGHKTLTPSRPTLTPTPSSRLRHDSIIPTRALRRPDLLGDRYQLVDKLGEGAMGTVYKAVHRDLGREFAVKILRPNAFDQSQGRELFLNEARIASSLVHPNVVSVTDFGIDPGHGPFLVMELLKGETLRARIDRAGALPEASVLDIGTQLVEAIRFVHDRGVIHCDLKPDNLFLSVPPGEPRRKNYVQILDFGLSARDVQTGAVAGTPPYMAPERILGGPPTVLSDVYSIGAILYEMATGRPTFRSPVAIALATQVVQSDPPPPATVAAVDERLSQAIMRCLARTPAERFPSSSALLRDLAAIMEQAGLRPSRTPTRPAEADRFDTFAWPLAILNAAGRIVFHNTAFARAITSAHSGVVGHHLTDLFSATHLPDTVEKVTFTRGARGWVKLPQGGRIYLTRVETDADVQVHVTIVK